VKTNFAEIFALKNQHAHHFFQQAPSIIRVLALLLDESLTLAAVSIACRKVCHPER